MAYSGDDITIEEMPQGCVISSLTGTVVISSLKDAYALRNSIDSLIEFLEQDPTDSKL